MDGIGSPAHNGAAMAALARRLLTATLAVGLLVASIVAVLWAPVASSPVRRPLFPRGRGEARTLPLPTLVAGDPSDGSTPSRATLVTGAVEDLLQAPRLALVLGPVDRRARLLGAQLRLLGGTCSWDSTGMLVLDEETAIPLDRAATCDGETRTGPAEVTLLVRSEGAVALGVLRPRDDAPREPGFLRVREGANEELLVRLFAVEPSARAPQPRVALLAHVWQELRPAEIGIALATSALFAMVGALLFPWSGASGPRLVAGAGLGMGLFAAALAVAYATLVPPLAALDEPYHLRSYAALTNRPELDGDVQRWSELAHVTRVRFQPDQRFRPEDVENPFVRRDAFSFVPDVRSRSAATAAFWLRLAPLLGRASAPRTLLGLRLANGCLFALSVGLAAAFLAAAAPARWPQLLAVPFLLIPSLPFFATALAELAVLTAAATLFAAGLVTLVLDGPRSSWAGLPLGIGTALLFAGGRSPWPVVALLASVLLARVVLGPRAPARPAREAALFWGGQAVGVAAFFLLADPVYVGGVSSDRIVAIAPHGLGAVAVGLVRSPLPALALLILAAVLEAGLSPWRTRFALRIAGGWRRAWRAAALVATSLVGLSLLGSLLLRYPSLPLVPIPNPYPTAEYVGRAAAALLTALRLREPDFLTFSSFWGGFGWLDTIPPAPFLVGLSIALAAAVVGLLLHLRRADDPRPPAFLLALGAGAAASVVLYGIAIHRLPMNMTGRYMASWHIALAAVAGSAAALWDERPSCLAAVPFPRTAWLLLVAGGMHAYSLGFILRRYF